MLVLRIKIPHVLQYLTTLFFDQFTSFMRANTENRTLTCNLPSYRTIHLYYAGIRNDKNARVVCCAAITPHAPCGTCRDSNPDIICCKDVNPKQAFVAVVWSGVERDLNSVYRTVLPALPNFLILGRNYWHTFLCQPPLAAHRIRHHAVSKHRGKTLSPFVVMSSGDCGLRSRRLLIANQMLY